MLLEERGRHHAAQYQSATLFLEIRYELADCYFQQRMYILAVDQWREIAALQEDFRDVRQKLLEFSKYGKDRVQDFLVYNNQEFEHASRFVISSLGLTPGELLLESSSVISTDALDRHHKQMRIFIRRDDAPLREQDLEIFAGQSAEQTVVISAGGFTPNAIKYSLEKKLQLVGKNQLASLLRQYEYHLAARKK